MGDKFSSMSDWHGCYVIFHVKLLIFGRFRALIFLAVFEPCFFCDDLVSSRLWGFGIFLVLCFQPLRSRSRVIWTSKVTYIRVRGLVTSISSTNHR
jgi:hypothetical protein